MAILNDNLRLSLFFLEELKQVEILATANRFGSQLSIMGIVKGKDQLEVLLEEAGIDRALFFSSFWNSTSAVTVYDRSPKQIADELENAFQKANELQLKMLNGNTLTDAELSFAAPVSLTVYSSSVGTDEGLGRIKTWFNKTAYGVHPKNLRGV